MPRQGSVQVDLMMLAKLGASRETWTNCEVLLRRQRLVLDGRSLDGYTTI